MICFDEWGPVGAQAPRRDHLGGGGHTTVAVETHSTERTPSSVKERMRVKQGRLTIAVMYTDKSTAADGILKIKLSGGQVGKGNLQVMGSNTASTLPRGSRPRCRARAARRFRS